MKKVGKIFLGIMALISLFTITACNDDDKELLPSEKLKLTTEIGSNDFRKNGIGKLKVFRYNDGDTVFFGHEDDYFKLRFLAVDTPETVGTLEPFGKKASQFTYDRLSKAKSIVGESDIVGIPAKFDNYHRYLGFVWYIPEDGTDYVNLNLELMENGFSELKQTKKYSQEFNDAYLYATNNRLGIYSGEDKDFSKNVLDVNIKDLALSLDNNNPFIYENKRVRFEGYVVKNYHEAYDTGNSVIVEGVVDGKKYQVPVYKHTDNDDVFNIGNKCVFVGYATDFNGLRRITGVTLEGRGDIHSEVIQYGYYLQFGIDVGIITKVNHFYTAVNVTEIKENEAGQPVILGKAKRGVTDFEVSVTITLIKGRAPESLVGREISLAGYTDKDITKDTADISVVADNLQLIAVRSQ